MQLNITLHHVADNKTYIDVDKGFLSETATRFQKYILLSLPCVSTPSPRRSQAQVAIRMQLTTPLTVEYNQGDYCPE
jgi:hypothetical protein